MDTKFLTIPLKKSTEVNIINTLKSIAPNTPHKIENLQKLRNDVTQVIKNEKYTEETLNILIRYFDQVSSLQNKIPHKLSGLSIQWVDAFKTTFGSSGPVLSYLDYERISLLFNIAVLESQLGNKCKNSGRDEDLKVGAKWLQSAAGCLTQIKTIIQQNPNLKEDLKGANDLNDDTLSSLCHLMISQAQELFVAKSIKDGMKEALIAKLCIQAAALYTETLTLMTKQSVKFIWDKTWLPHLSGKQQSYEALSQYFQSKHCGNMKRVGEQITRLKLFLELQKKAEVKMGNSSLLDQCKMEATRNLTEAVKDNDFIYHELVPETHQLAPIELAITARLAKPIIPSQYLGNSPDDFHVFDDCLVEKKTETIEKETKSKTVKSFPKFGDEPIPRTTQIEHRNQGGFVQYLYGSYEVISEYVQSFFTPQRPTN